MEVIEMCRKMLSESNEQLAAVVVGAQCCWWCADVMTIF
jgi:hypothetical protein